MTCNADVFPLRSLIPPIGGGWRQFGPPLHSGSCTMGPRDETARKLAAELLPAAVSLLEVGSGTRRPATTVLAADTT